MNQVDQVDIVKQIYSTIEKPELWQDVLIRLSEILGSSHAFIACRSSVDHSPSRFVAHGFESGHFETYQAHFYKVDMWTQGLARHDVNQFHPSHLVCNDKQFIHSEIYTDFAKPAAIRNSIGCLIAKPESSLITEIAFMSGPETVYYSQQQVAAANAFLPHIDHALDMSLRMQQANATNTQHALLDVLPEAIFVCGRHTELHYFNASAQVLLSKSKLFQLSTFSSRYLAFASSAVDAQFKMALGVSALTCGTEFDERFYAWDAENIYRVTIKPWFHQVATSIGPQTLACCLVMVQACASKLKIHPQEIMSLFSLTLAEAEVTSLLCAGSLVEEIAILRHATSNTIRQQIKACLAKTATRNQAELVAKVIRSVTLI
ncbi:helix-turn-helix transcriptional regulator [Motilimonas sp. KMU-193]|uniref:helix-turn-helix transcriptional regulator n=1 Tax=Motilimonas sp. KMU-193 TaxID=3388668 RepID=UPI00396B0EE5